MKTLRHSNPRRLRSGAVLLDMIVSITLGAILFTAVAAMSLFTAKGFIAVGNYSDLDRDSRNALDQLTRDVRQSRQLTAFTTNTLTLQDNDSNTLVYSYSPTTKLFTRAKSGRTTTLLSGCDFLSFTIYQRWPSNGFNFYTISNTLYAQAKLVDVSWRCSRKIYGASPNTNTESVQTAKIVIRN